MATESTDTSSQPVSAAVVEMARQAVRDFHECFWFRHPNADITNREDVEIVIDRLRRLGGHSAWERSNQIRSCL